MLEVMASMALLNKDPNSTLIYNGLSLIYNREDAKVWAFYSFNLKNYHGNSRSLGNSIKDKTVTWKI